VDLVYIYDIEELLKNNEYKKEQIQENDEYQNRQIQENKPRTRTPLFRDFTQLLMEIKK